MKLDQLRDYLTMSEVAYRWRATDPDMCRGVLKGLIRPSLYVNDKLKAAEVAEDGTLRLIAGESELVRGWYYATPIDQVGALDCRVETVGIVHELIPGSQCWALPEPLSMASLLQQSVLMQEDIAYAEGRLDEETTWQQRSAATKEINSVLNTLSAVLADAYSYDPRVRSSIAREIAEASVRHGIAISQGTVKKWLTEAIERFPPSYMNERVVTREREAA